MAQVAAQTDPLTWGWWQEALAGRIGQITTEPMQGFYRARQKGGQWEPVAIWFEGGRWEARRSGNVVEDAAALWTFCCRHPITYEAYLKAVAGGGFDDEPPAPIGHNSASTGDPYQDLLREFTDEKEQADEILKKGIHSQDDANKASIWKDRFLKIKSRAAALFKEEKQPILDEGRAVDDKWRSLAHDKDSDTAKMVEQLRRAMEGFLKAKKAEEEERQKKAAAEAEKVRHEAEEAVRQAALAEDAAIAAQAGVGPEDGPTPEEAAAAQFVAQQALERLRQAEREAHGIKVSAGRTGATTSFRKEKVAVVTDYAKAAAALVAMKHPDIIACIDTLAKRAVKAGMPFDGVEAKEEDRLL